MNSVYFQSVINKTPFAYASEYRDRVLADGGEVIDFAYVESVYKKLKELKLLNTLAFWISGNAGIKKDASNYVSKVYSLSGSDTDVVQTTASKQPLWDANYFVLDGVDDSFKKMTSGSMGITNKITFISKIIPRSASGPVFEFWHDSTGLNGSHIWLHDTSTELFTNAIDVNGTSHVLGNLGADFTANQISDISMHVDGLNHYQFIGDFTTPKRSKAYSGANLRAVDEYFYIGVRPGAAIIPDFKFFDMQFFNTAITADQRNAIKTLKP